MKPAAANHFSRSSSTSACPGAISWLGGGGGDGENSNFGWSGFSHYANNGYVYKNPVWGYRYDWETGKYYAEHYFGDYDEEVSYDVVNRNVILPNATTTYIVPSGMQVHIFLLYGKLQVIVSKGDPGQLIQLPNGGYDFSNLNGENGGATYLSLLSNDGSAGGGVPGWIGWTNNLATTVAYGAVKAGGSIGFLRSGAVRWYSNAWKGSQYVETYNLTKFGWRIGVGTAIVGAFIGTVDFALSDKSWGDYGQLGVSLLSAGLTLDGFTAPAGIGIGLFDAGGGFNSFYNYLDLNQQLYNGTGGLILPLNGVPQYFQIK